MFASTWWVAMEAVSGAPDCNFILTIICKPQQSKEGKELDEKLGAAEYQEIMNELNQSKAELKKVTAELNVAQGAHDDAASEIRKAKGEIQRLEMERKALIAEIEG